MGSLDLAGSMSYKMEEFERCGCLSGREGLMKDLICIVGNVGASVFGAGLKSVLLRV